MTSDLPPLRVLALAKQVPVAEQLRLEGGRLVRDGVAREMSAWCRRAVAQGVALARATGGTCTVATLGPPEAGDVLREAVAFGADAGILVSDPVLAGSDTLITARALAALVEREGPFDLVLTGRASLDADTGQVGPQLAELLDLPFASSVRHLELVRSEGGAVAARVGLEHDDLWLDAEVRLPAVLSTAERLIDPCKIKDPAVWATVPDERLRRLAAADLGPGPWGAAASPTEVGATRAEAVERAGRRLSGPIGDQAREAVAVLASRGALEGGGQDGVASTAREAATADRRVPDAGGAGPVVVVLLEPGRARLARQLLGGAAELAAVVGGSVVAVGALAEHRDGALDDPASATAGGLPAGPGALASWGADELVVLAGSWVPEDLAAPVADLADGRGAWALLAPSTDWGRELASRASARLGAGLTGDAVDLEVSDGRLVAWKPAFGGGLLAAVRARSPLQGATVRPGVLAVAAPRPADAPPTEVVAVAPAGRVRIRARRRDDETEALAAAEVVVGVGQGVDPDRYPLVEELARALGGEVVATRKVTDRGWMPRARQVGITGLSLHPRLYVALGTSGRFNHMAGVRSAGTVLAVNADPGAEVFDVADVGIVGDWQEAVGALLALLGDVGAPSGGAGAAGDRK